MKPRMNNRASNSVEQFLISTRLQPGDGVAPDALNRFSGFMSARETAEAVVDSARPGFTQLKQGANETLHEFPPFYPTSDISAAGTSALRIRVHPCPCVVER